MAKTINVFDAPSEFWDCWEWTKALDAFDYGDRSILANLVAQKDVPTGLKAAVSKTILGTRKPNLKAAAKLKIEAKDRLQAAAWVSMELGYYELHNSGPHIELPEASGLSFDEWRQAQGDFHTRKIDQLADEYGLEASEVRSFLEHKSRETVQKAADEHGVSTYTIEGWLRDFREKIRNFPDV